MTIGNNVVLDGTSHTVTLWTYRKHAEIYIGNNAFLNDTRFGCQQKIVIAITASSQIVEYWIQIFAVFYPIKEMIPDLLSLHR